MLSSQKVIQAFSEYMLDRLNLRLEPKLWGGSKDAPFFLQDLYNFYTLSILGKTCLLTVPKIIDAATPAAIRKHLLHLQELSGFPCIYLTTSISAHNRQRLIEHGVQCVVPEKLIYLPALGVDWSERHNLNQKKIQSPLKKRLSPSSQAVILYGLMHEGEKTTTLELAKKLNYTPMTMIRALDELESFDLYKTSRQGRERLIHFTNPVQMWNLALPIFQNPTKKRIWLKLDKKGLQEVRSHGFLSGLCALATLSMLSAPDHQTYAVSLESWKSIRKSKHTQIVPNADGADIELEVWSYDPGLFSSEGKVDKFSLYLSLNELGDERVEAALENLLKRE